MPEQDSEVHDGLQSAFDESVHEGEQRLARSLPSLIATGAVGGIDVSLGVFALVVVYTQTNNLIAASLAFSIGFIALTLAGSELFTENFLIPIAAIVAKKSTPVSVLRLWAGTLVMNLIAGWVITGIIVAGFPRVHGAAVHFGSEFLVHGIGGVTLASAVFGGMLITIMTWMERGTESPMAKVASAIAIAFLLADGGIHHSIVLSLEMFAALHAGAPFGYLDWLRVFGWAALGNMLGGIGLVTVLRLLQLGPEHLAKVRDDSDRKRRRRLRRAS